jgi:endoglucanase
MKKGDSEKVPEFKDLYIDLGLTGEEVRKKVCIGDRIFFKAPVTELLNGRIASRALDNKISVYAILVTLKKLKKLIKDKELDCRIAVLFATQEELGSRGAKTGIYSIEADEAYVLDVTFAKQPDLTSQIMGEGIVIERSTHFDRNLVRNLVAVAKKKDIKYQTNAEARSGGTDATAIQTSGKGVPTVLLSIPIRYMHTPVETGDINDVESAADLLAEYIKTHKISENRG